MKHWQGLFSPKNPFAVFEVLFPWLIAAHALGGTIEI